MTYRIFGFLALGCFLSLSPSAHAEDALYLIKSVNEGKGDVWVDNAYSISPCIEVVVMVKENLGTKKPFLKAYFFNKDKKLVETMKSPSALGSSNPPGYGDPGVYERNKKYTLLFGIRKAFQRGEVEPWKTVIVVFGDEKEIAVDATPKRAELDDFDFPEKARYLGQAAAIIAPK